MWLEVDPKMDPVCSCFEAVGQGKGIYRLEKIQGVVLDDQIIKNIEMLNSNLRGKSKIKK